MTKDSMKVMGTRIQGDRILKVLEEEKKKSK